MSVWKRVTSLVPTAAVATDVQQAAADARCGSLVAAVRSRSLRFGSLSCCRRAGRLLCRTDTDGSAKDKLGPEVALPAKGRGIAGTRQFVCLQRRRLPPCPVANPGHRLDLKGKTPSTPRPVRIQWGLPGARSARGADKRRQQAHRRTHNKGREEAVCVRWRGQGSSWPSAAPSSCQLSSARSALSRSTSREGDAQGPICQTQAQCPPPPSSLTRCCGLCECLWCTVCLPTVAAERLPSLSATACASLSACGGCARES
jgi:hypothetical protein